MTATTVFDIARRLADPEFRRWLTASGFRHGMEVYTAAIGETDEQVRARMSRGTHLLVVAAPREKGGLRARLLNGPADGPELPAPTCTRRRGEVSEHACCGIGEHSCTCCCGEAL